MSLRVGITKRFSEAPWPCQTPCRGWSHAQTFDQVYKAASERIDRQLSNVTGAQYAIRSELTCPDDSQLWWDTCSKVLGATS